MGLINVEDRSGALSLDKGDLKRQKMMHLLIVWVWGLSACLWRRCSKKSPTFVAETDYNNIGKFLNRILGMEVQQQNALFQYFSDTLAAVIQEAKKNGRYDMGILGAFRTVKRSLLFGDLLCIQVNKKRIVSMFDVRPRLW